MKRILLAFIALFVAFIGLKVNAQEMTVNISSNEGSLNSDNNVWTSASSFTGYDGIESHLTIGDANAWSDYHLAIDDNSFTSTVGAVLGLYQETHNIVVTAPTDWSIVGYSFNLSTSGVEVSFGSYSNQTSNGQSYSISNLQAKSFSMTVHATGWVRGSATLNNFKIILKKNNYRAPVMSVAQSTDLPTKSSYKKAETAPTEGNPTPFLITSTSNNYALGNTTTPVGLTLINDEYTSEVNINGKPYTFVFESNGKIRCGNQYLNASVSGSGNSRKATLSLASSSNTTWKIEKNGEAYRISYEYKPLFGSGTTFYLTAPSRAEGKFSLEKTAASVHIFNGVVKPLEFSIKANAAEGSNVNYATLYCEDAYEMPGTDIVGYFIMDASQEGGELTHEKRYESGDVVPAGTSLLLTGTAGSYSATRYVKNAGNKTAREYTDADRNQLEGTRTADGMTASSRDNVYYYKLTWKDVDQKELGVIFYWGAENGGAFKLVNPYTAYLAVDKTSNARSFNMPGMEDIDDTEVNSIDEVEASNTDNAVYTISGIRVNDTTNLPSGIYIRNGKKFMVR